MTQTTFLTIRQAAKHYNVHHTTVRRWIKKGILKFHKDPTSGIVWIDQKEFDRLQCEFNKERQNNPSPQ